MAKARTTVGVISVDNKGLVRNGSMPNGSGIHLRYSERNNNRTL